MRRFSPRALLVLFVVTGASSAGGQMASPTMSDATVVTRGAFRVRGEVRWTRIDGIFGPGGKEVLPLGASLTGDVGVTMLPLLTNAETAARVLAADPAISLSAGRLTTSVDSRIATVPITAEYGLTSRITLGAVIPIVQSRSVVTSQLNGRSDSTANVGTNPAAFHGSAAAYGANATVANGIISARDQLEQRIAQCAANPVATGCSTINSRAAEASALVASSSSFAQAIGSLYGVSNDQPGAVFVPLTGSALQAAIEARLAGLRADFTSFGINGGSGSPTPAGGPAANAQLDRIVRDADYGIELDSIGTTEQTAVGDIELSITGLLFNSFGSTSRVRLRGAAAGVVRLGTGHPARPNRPFDIATGDGQTDLEVRGALDVMTGRLLTTLAGTYTVQTGSVATTRLPTTMAPMFLLDIPVAGSVKPGNMAAVRINPRFMITRALMVGALGVGSFRAADEVTMTGFAPGGVTFGNGSLTTYAGGLTISYSNLASATGVGDRRFPAEIVFSHLETLSASAAGAEKLYRDSIELRLYLRTRR
ncbi:MAG TPA: hypothetical protein VFO55_11505 [Gemmatimonadaceae bacterium]|nr:hypothetical protein [Gemmatimonadaceae bacterium]